ncbi:MAG: NUDIX domain-containing protein [Nanoarchaeota archaeon]|nr:NUDIX domain-containing protein [Nanoarchaeota archaeon]
MTELFDILDENGNKTGKTENKKIIHEKGLWHSAVHIWIYNSKGEILLQKRAMNKDYWPGRWDISSAGHISAGETPEHSVVRELEEELGIKVMLSNLKKIKIRKSTNSVPEINYYNNEFDHVFLFRFDGDISELKFEDGEVEKVKFISAERFEKELNDKELLKTYVPHRQYYFDIIEAVKKELIK